MSSPAALVDRALRLAGIPIDGVSMGNPADRSTWSVQFSAAATPAHRVTAASLLLSVPIDAAALAAGDQLDAQVLIDTLPIWAKAIVLTLIDELNILRVALSLPPRTVAQALAGIRAKAGQL